jgi:cytidylate kinase
MQADDAVRIDTSDMTQPEVVDRLAELVRSRSG